MLRWIWRWRPPKHSSHLVQRYDAHFCFPSHLNLNHATVDLILFLKDTFEWKFVVTNGELPEKRSHHTSVVEGHSLIVFGGLSQEGKRLNDLHVLDLCTFSMFSMLNCVHPLVFHRRGRSTKIGSTFFQTEADAKFRNTFSLFFTSDENVEPVGGERTAACA